MKISLSSLYEWYRNAIRHPQYRWLVILGTLVYFISPLDISPDIFPIAGQIDDVVLLTLLVTEIYQMMVEKLKTSKLEKDTAQPNNVTVDVEAETVSTDKV
ncbi:MAG: YkvA family protein [Xenococcaceae cyanobacterium MO_207.B15]|nr:YkvA family protein [Xenococcaceae cyanobacterium MO_207.B15]MDJ0744852.1 YkvA family protein [Xenococcaceae cyanobacterium MO_167.B27]